MTNEETNTYFGLTTDKKENAKILQRAIRLFGADNFDIDYPLDYEPEREE